MHAPLRLAWLGPLDDPCGQLVERVRQRCHATQQSLQVTQLHGETLGGDALSSADRLVLACEARVDYPWRAIMSLQGLEQTVPWGVVTSVWHAGSRRTGIGTVSHWQLPWYRWWEGWSNWFFPEQSRPGAVCPTQFEAVTLPIDLATPSAIARISTASRSKFSETAPTVTANHLLIVAACAETGQAWQLMAERAHWSAAVLRPGEAVVGRTHNQRTRVTGVLWDDSSLDRLPGGDSRAQARARCSTLRQMYPEATLLVGLTLGHLAMWSELQSAGASDFFIKPSFGLPLTDYLTAHSSLHEEPLTPDLSARSEARGRG